MPLTSVTEFTKTFVNDERGTISVEFSILLTAIFMVVVMFVSISVRIATTSEVQQAAHDLTRQSLRYIDNGLTGDAVCSELRNDVLEKVTDQLTFLDIARIATVTCQVEDDGTVGTVSVYYNTSGSFLDRAAALFGYDLDMIQRSARIVL